MKEKKFCLLAFLLVLITGCKSAEFNTQENTLKLKGNPTTGYTWTYVIGDESVIEVEEKIEYLGSNDIVGAPSLFTYTVKSLKPGNTTLEFEYKRPWESQAPEEIRIYEVQVFESGKIKLTEKTDFSSVN